LSACWAAPLGGCKGGITGEHLFSKSIFIGKNVEVRGAPWFKGASKVIPRDAAVGNILCAHHNNTLGEYADPAAKLLREAMQDSVRNRPVPGTAYVRSPGGVLLPRPRVIISGPHLGAWLCKTHCNMIANTGGTPAIEYVKYAFEPRNPAIYFYYPHGVGENVGFTDLANTSYINFNEPGEPFAIQICGHWMLVALQPTLVEHRYLSRPREIRFATLTLELDWRDDPPPDEPATHLEGQGL
jgi:hypothetical protein